MNEESITKAALVAINALGGRARLDEIYAYIIDNELFEFNTPTPEHVLETQIKRRLFNSTRTDTTEPILFKMNDDQSYELIGKSVASKSSSTRSKGAKRVMRATDKADLIEELMSDNIGVFREIWRLLLFSAQIGIKKGRKEPLNSIDSGKGIDQATFGNSSAWPGILYLMSLAETGDSSLLSGDNNGDDQRISLFEEYANGGLSELQEYFSANSLSIESLLSFIEVNALNAVNNDREIDLSI